jgi:MFS family permease
LRALAAYRGLLENKPLSRLLAGEFVSGIGDWLYIVGILVVIYTETQSAVVLGLFGAARMAPYIVLSIPAGVITDRFDRRLVLLVSDLFRGACMLGMAALVAFDGPVWAIVVLAILAACGSTFFYPAIGAYIPSLVRNERELGPANSAWASLDNVGFILGPALGGVLVATGGVTFAFLINAATFLVIAVVLWRLPPSLPSRERRVEGEEDGAGVPIAAAGSSRALRAAARPLGGIVVIDAAAKIIHGGVGVLTVIVAVEILHAGEAATGYLNTAIGIGGVLGAVGSGILVLRRRLAPPLLLGAVALAVGALALGGSGALVAAMAAIAVISAGNIVVEVVTTTILQRVTTDEIRGRATGITMTVATLAEALGSLLVPIAVAAVGIGAAMAGTAIAMLIAVVAGLVLIGAAATRAPSAFEETLGRVAKLPLFTGVGASSLEAALERLTAVPVAAGEVVIRQGDPADRFYIVQEGTFRVTQTDPTGETRVLRELGPDTVFGELGLLSGAPRSATVTAMTAGTLLALDGPDFLELVGRGGGPLRRRLLELYQPSDPDPAVGSTPA